MSYYMLSYSNNAIPTFDQSVIYQHHHPFYMTFDDKVQSCTEHYTLMDLPSSFTMSTANATPKSTLSSRSGHSIPLSNAGNNDYQSSISSLSTIHHLQDNLGYLQDEWAAIDIVLNSLKTAFPAQPIKVATEEHLENVDRELGIAYDDLMAQVRSLDRNLKRLDNKIQSCRSSGSST